MVQNRKVFNNGHIEQDRVECYGIDIDNFEADIEASMVVE